MRHGSVCALRKRQCWMQRRWSIMMSSSRSEGTAMSFESRRLAGILLVLMPTVIMGGASILRLLISDPAYAENALRQDLWRAGHAHAGVLLILSLIVLRYVDEATLSD